MAHKSVSRLGNGCIRGPQMAQVRSSGPSHAGPYYGAGLKLAAVRPSGRVGRQKGPSSWLLSEVWA